MSHPVTLRLLPTLAQGLMRGSLLRWVADNFAIGQSLFQFLNLSLGKRVALEIQMPQLC